MANSVGGVYRVRPSVLIAGPPTYGTCRSIARAFEQEGWRSRIYQWRFVPWRFHQRFRAAALVAVDRMTTAAREFNRTLETEVLPAVLKESPELLLVVMPYRPTKQVYASIKAAGVPVVIWATDSLERYPQQADLAELAKRFYAMDGGEAVRHGASWLPLGYDDSVFLVGKAADFEWDVLFVGNISGGRYRQRRSYLELLRDSDLARSHRVGFIGSSGSRLENRLGWMPGHIDWISTGLTLEELAVQVRSSRICVNIHQDDGTMPVNPMLFAVAGSGACQLLDDRSYWERWMVPGRDVATVTREDFLDTLAGLLSDDTTRQTLVDSALRAARGHTFRARVRQICGDCGVAP